MEETFTIFPRAPLSHVRKDELGQPRRPEQVHLELVARIVQRYVFHRPVQSETRVVDEDVPRPPVPH